MVKQKLLFDLNEVEPPIETFPAAFLNRPDKSPILRQVHIEALKGIDDITIELSPPFTVLTGPNNSGKSTVLQGILLGFDVLRRCVDTSSWKILKTGRALPELEYLRVNHPKDLWFRHAWREGKRKERYIRIELKFDNDFQFVARVRFLYGALNIGIESYSPDPEPDFLRAILSAAPILLPPSGGPTPHESVAALAQLHYVLSTGDPGTVLRNIIWQIQQSNDKDAWRFISEVSERYFGVILKKIDFNEKFDLEIRAGFEQADFTLDIASGGSGLNQVLQLAAIIAWRKPGIVLLDEPDAHLHSTLQEQLIDFLCGLSEHYGLQIIASTHSRDLISQAPLQSILPIDLTRKELKPISSLEHLLFEYQRQGAVSNVDIALLYQTKKCLFVEGPNDRRLLPKIAERLGSSIFKGRYQVVTFEFEGVNNIKLIPKLVQLFERMIGASLSWMVLRDRDANIPEVIDAYKAQAEESGISKLFVWDSYCLENMLLDPQIVHQALLKLKGENAPTLEDMQMILCKAIEIIKPDVGGVYVTKTQSAYRNLSRDNPFDSGARDAINFFSSLQTMAQCLQYYPGKKLFGRFVQILQEQYSINLRFDDIISVLRKEDAPEGFKKLFSILEEL